MKIWASDCSIKQWCSCVDYDENGLLPSVTFAPRSLLLVVLDSCRETGSGPAERE